jgi:hypothetical protein
MREIGGIFSPRSSARPINKLTPMICDVMITL